jgi:hypothetical protein
MACMLAATTAFGDEPDGPEDVHAPSAPAPPSAPPVYVPPPPVYATPPMPTLEPAEIQQLESSGRSMRAGGAVMLAVGAAMDLAGLILVTHAQISTTSTCTTRANVTSCSSDLNIPELATGIAIGLAGPGLIYGGIAVLSAGKARIRRAHAMRMQIAPSLSATTLGARVAVEF